MKDRHGVLGRHVRMGQRARPFPEGHKKLFALFSIGLENQELRI